MEINNISPVSCKANYLIPFADSIKLSNKRTLHIKGDKNYLEAIVTKKTKNGKDAVVGGYHTASNRGYSAIDKAVFLDKISKRIIEAKVFLDDFFASQHL